MFVKELKEGFTKWAAVLDPAQLMEVVKQGGRLTISQVLRLEVGYIERAVVFGTMEFVDGVFREFVQGRCKRRKRGAWLLEEGADWRGLAVLRKVKDPIQMPELLPADPLEETAELAEP